MNQSPKGAFIYKRALLSSRVLHCDSLPLSRLAEKFGTPLYVYDEDKISTRVSIQENFSASNAPPGRTALSVEVCGSDFKPLPSDQNAVAEQVQRELIEMGLVEGADAIESVAVRYCPWGQVIYDHNRRHALDAVNRFLDRVNVLRAGRYAQWGYMMTHDCVLRAKKISEHLADRRIDLPEFAIDE